MNRIPLVKHILFLKTHYISSFRHLTISAILCERKSLKPYDRRYDINPLDVDPKNEGGSETLVKYLKRRGCEARDPGYYDKDDKFHFIPEMMPEFVVPDLTNFELKPYVSYKVSDIRQSEFTPRELFNACYGPNIREAYSKSKQLDKDTLLQSGRITKLREIRATDK